MGVPGEASVAGRTPAGWGLVMRAGWMASGVLVGLALAAAGMAAPPVERGTVLPDFTGTDVLSGEAVSLADYRGKVVLVDFWATWCTWCKVEMPYLIEARTQFADQGFEIIGVSLDKGRASSAAVQRFLRSKEASWPNIYEQGHSIASEFQVGRIPQCFLLDREGKVIATGLRREALVNAVQKAVTGKVRTEAPAPWARDGLEELEGERARVASRWLRIARGMAANGNYRLAQKYYGRVVVMFPRSRHAALAEQALSYLPDRAEAVSSKADAG